MRQRPQTVPDSLGASLQMGGSPFDSAGLRSTDKIRMACKRPGVRVPLAPHEVPGQGTVLDLAGLLTRSFDRRLTVVLGVVC